MKPPEAALIRPKTYQLLPRTIFYFIKPLDNCNPNLPYSWGYNYHVQSEDTLLYFLRSITRVTFLLIFFLVWFLEILEILRR